MQKRLILSLLMILTLSILFLPYPSIATQTIQVIHNGQTLAFDVPPTVIEGRTLVPLRAIFESLGISMTWDPETSTIRGRSTDRDISLQIDSADAVVNGQEVTIDVPATLINGRTMVPARFVAEASGAQVVWHDGTRTIEITSVEEHIAPPSPSPIPVPREDQQLSTVELAERSKAAVLLTIYGPNGQRISSGSGFYVDVDGKIATNFHVISGAHRIEVIDDDGSRYNGGVHVLGYDVEQDIALIQIEKKSPDYMRLGDSNALQRGEAIVVIGSPFGLQNTLSEGIVSSLRNQDIQITAPISPGSSGGALLNRTGEVVGITYAGITDGENLGFAIPIERYREMSKDENLTLVAFNRLANQMETPTGLKLTQVTDSSMYIYWDPVDGADYYAVFVSEGTPDAFTEIKPDSEAAGFQWDDDFCVNYYNLTPGETYYVRVAAVKNGAVSPFTEIMTLTLAGHASYDDYAAYLIESNGRFTYAGYNLNFYQVVITEGDDGSELRIVYLFSGDENIGDEYWTFLDKKGDAFEDHFGQIAVEAGYYYEKDVSLGLAYTGFYDTYPNQYEENSLYGGDTVEKDEENDRWAVFYPVMLINAPLEDDYFYPSWAN